MKAFSVRERRPAGIRALGLGLAAGSLMLWSGVANAAPPPESFSGMVKKVAPSVVSVIAAQEMEGPQGAMPELPFAVPKGSPFEEFFEQFRERFGEGPGGQGEGRGRPPMAAGLGSGFVIDASGYIVTNNHVIDRASTVKVRLDDDSTHDAEIVGTDPQTDLALLKIEAGRELPVVPFGDSDAMEVGDWVLAMGNPFGLGNTATAGIVSARGRNIQAGPYDDFLQIDAPINRGNSGGPLFGMDGRVVGVNTAIFSPNGGSVGIGFAIPSNIAKDVVAQLKESGTVERGWLGVQIQPVGSDIAEALDIESGSGAMVTEVMPDSPASAAGVRQGDVILDFAGQKVDGPRDLARIVAGRKADSEAEMTVWRDGERTGLSVTLGRLEQDRMARAEPRPDADTAPDETVRSGTLDAELAALTPERRQRLGIPEEVDGVLVVDIGRGSPLEQGLRPGDIIRRVGETKVDSPREVEMQIEAAREASRKAVLVLVSRQGQDLFLGLKLRDA